MKDKIMKIISGIIKLFVGIIFGIIIYLSILNIFKLFTYRTDTTLGEKIIPIIIYIMNIILIIITCSNYKKWKKSIIITIIFIYGLSLIIPIKKDEEWITIYNPNPPGFFGAGAPTFEKYEEYYNIYGICIKLKATGEKKKGGN